MQLQQLRSSDLFPVRAFEVFCQLLTVLTAEPMHQFLVLRAIILRIAKVTHTALFETFWDTVWLSSRKTLRLKPANTRINENLHYLSR